MTTKCCFSDDECEIIDIKSRPNNFKCNVESKSKSTLTDIGIIKHNTQSQTNFDNDQSIQTQDYHQNNIIQLSSLSSKQLSSLNTFLSNIEPLIITELKENKQTMNLFNDYIVEWDDGPNSIYLQNKIDFDVGDGICIDCNSTNSRIAIGYASKQESNHSSWCLHSSNVVIYNILNNTSMKIEISACCTSIRYHPIYDNIIAFGLFNGLISIWELNNNGNSLLNREICKTLIGNDLYHKQVITDLYWIKSNGNLVSISIDGKLLIWNFEYNQLLNPIIGYRLIPTKIYNPNNTNILNEIGIKNIAFPYNNNNDEYNSFIIGTQSGQIINCLFNDNNYQQKNKKVFKDGKISFNFMAYKFYKNMKNKSDQIEIKRNIEKYMKLNKNIKIIKLSDIFEANKDNNSLYPAIKTQLLFDKKHIGFVNNIQFSPFSRNIFLISTINGYLQIFSIFSSLPIIQIKYKNYKIFDAKWSPIRPCIIAIICGDNNNNQQLLIYDLSKNKNIPINIIKVNDNNNIKLNKLCFNKLGNKIFITDNNSNLYIYQLSNILIQHKPKEIKHLQQWINLRV